MRASFYRTLPAVPPSRARLSRGEACFLFRDISIFFRTEYIYSVPGL